MARDKTLPAWKDEDVFDVFVVDGESKVLVTTVGRGAVYFAVERLRELSLLLGVEYRIEQRTKEVTG